MSAALFKEGDWHCEACGDHQFERNTMCRKCGAPKPMLSSNNQASKVGDWICPNPACKDLQFERNSVCRKCSTPKPAGVATRPESKTITVVSAKSNSAPARANSFPTVAAGSSNGQKIAPDDWMCLRCGDHQFAKNVACRKCGAPRPAPFAGATAPMPSLRVSPGTRVAPDDWMCQNCGDHQFAKNLACRQCGAPKPMLSTNNQAAKVGDWICPNPSCRDLQFEKNETCRKCNTPKPGNAARASARGGSPAVRTITRPVSPGFGVPMMGGMGMAVQPGYGMFMQPGYGMPVQPFAMQTRGMATPPFGGRGAPQISSNQQILKPGDWICPNESCKDIQFGKNEVCRKCGTEKPLMSSNKQVFKDGDWICPGCKDVQFEKNTQCRKCQTPRPDDAGRSRSPVGRGFV